jgi:Methylamine utilisation protein MauE
LGALALGARIALAVVFAAAAVLKLRDLARVRVQMAELVGTRFARLAAVVVPIVELALALALVAFPASPIPGLLAAVVLLAFTAFLVRALLRHVPCPCFGGVATPEPVGPAAIVRNGVLLALAVLATG